MIDFTTHRAGTAIVVKPNVRRIDGHNAPELRAYLQNLIDQAHARIVLDLGHVFFVDSSGLGAIVFALRRVAGRGELALCNVHDAVGSLLRLTGVDRAVEVLDGPGDVPHRAGS